MREGEGKDDLAEPWGRCYSGRAPLAAPFSGRGSTAPKARFCQLRNVEFCSSRVSSGRLNRGDLLSPAE